MDKQIEELYKVFLEFPQICTDSRKVEEDSIFFALKGPNFNGNKYAEQALSQGAAYAVIDEERYSNNQKIILVQNVLSTLQSLSKYHRTQINIPVIGITGSNGKTTSKDLISSVLSKKYQVLATSGNFNNHIGVPLTILKINDRHDIAIIEMGTNGPGEIEFLCQLAQPDIGLITSIGKAHLEGLGDINGVVVEKTALYRSVADRDGQIIYNADSIFLKDHLPSNTHNIAFAKNGSLTLEMILHASFPSIRGLCKRGEREVALNAKMYGEYNVSNIISALTIGELFDVGIEDSVHAINDYDPDNNRSETRQFRGATIYLDAYNANPSSVALVLEQFSRSDGQKILILGDMLEVGAQEDLEHKNILSAVDKQRFEQVILLGALYGKHKEEFKSFKFFSDFDSLQEYFDSLDIGGKEILLKGSRGMGLERLIT